MKSIEKLNKAIATVKQGGGSVMIWGCMPAAGVGKQVFVDSETDISSGLSQSFESAFEAFRNFGKWIFQQDNDP